MPRLNVIVLDQDENDPSNYRYALWADVPTPRQTFYANPSAVSVWKGATAADNTNLQSGAVVEKVSSQRVPPGSTLAQVEGFLQNQWSAYQAHVTSFNPWSHYGSTWDGTTWAVVTVA